MTDPTPDDFERARQSALSGFRDDDSHLGNLARCYLSALERMQAAERKVEELEVRIEDSDIKDSASLEELRETVDSAIGWRDFEQCEAGDYVGRLKEVGALLNDIEKYRYFP